MSREHDDEQDDGGASAYDRKQRAKGRKAPPPPMEQPNGCAGCARTGRRIVAGHDRSGETVDVHHCYCGCPLGQHLRAREGGKPFFEVRDAITSSFRIAIVDPTPAQMKPGGAVVREIPKLGDYVPRRAAFQLLAHADTEYAPEIAQRGYRFATPPLTIAEARAKLGWPAEGRPVDRPVSDPARAPRTAHLLPLEGARGPAPRPTPSSFGPLPSMRDQVLDLGGAAPDYVTPDRAELAPGGELDGPPPWLDEDAQPPWLR